jgi:hypothetical protein
VADGDDVGAEYIRSPLEKPIPQFARGLFDVSAVAVSLGSDVDPFGAEFDAQLSAMGGAPALVAVALGAAELVVEVGGCDLEFQFCAELEEDVEEGR